MSTRQPFLRLTFHDADENVDGYLVIDRLVGGVAAGGLRVHEEVTLEEVAELAANMTFKQAAAGIRVGGAKAGLRMPPGHPRRRELLSRFLSALGPFIGASLSLGPDLNTSLAELEAIGRELGHPCLKIAVGRSRGVPDEIFLRRYQLFEQALPLGTVNDLRAPQAVAAATRVLLERLGVETARARVAIQGAGCMGGGSARLLAAAGARVVAWADDRKCLVDEAGLDVGALAAARRAGRLPDAAGASPSGAVLAASCDVLILAAVSRAFGPSDVARLRCRGLVEAANLALADEAEEALHAARIPLVPDSIASVGGSLAVEALYTGEPARGQDILDHVDRRAAALAGAVLDESERRRLPPRRVLRTRLEGAAVSGP